MGDALPATKPGMKKARRRLLHPSQNQGGGHPQPLVVYGIYSPGTTDSACAFPASEPIGGAYEDLLFRHRYRGRHRSERCGRHAAGERAEILSLGLSGTISVKGA